MALTASGRSSSNAPCPGAPVERAPERRRVDHAQDRPAVLDEAQADREERDAVEEVRRAVERVDDPDGALAVAATRALLRQQAVVGELLGEPPGDQRLGVAVGGGHEVAGPLARDLRAGQPPVALEQQRARLLRDRDRGVDHGGLLAARRRAAAANTRSGCAISRSSPTSIGS